MGFYDFSQDDDEQTLTGATTTSEHDDDGNDNQTLSPSETHTITGNNNSTTTKTITTSPYDQFKGKNYEELEKFLRNQIKSAEAETPEEREKREKREKRTMFLANLAEGLGTFHTAFSHARGVKAMDLPKMSAKAKERFEKAKSERDKDNDRLVNYAITLGKIKDADRDFNFRVTQAEQQQNNWQKTFDASRKDRADDVASRDKKFDSDNDHWQQGFDENKRQFDVTSKEHERHNRASEGLQAAGIAETRRHNKASEGLEGQRIAASQDGKYTKFYSGNGMIRIPNSRLNQHNISYVFSKTPSAGRPMPTTTLEGTKPVSADQMMDWIGSNIDDPNVQSALRAIGGEQSKKPLPGSETNGKKQLP